MVCVVVCVCLCFDEMMMRDEVCRCVYTAITVVYQNESMYLRDIQYISVYASCCITIKIHLFFLL